MRRFIGIAVFLIGFTGMSAFAVDAPSPDAAVEQPARAVADTAAPFKDSLLFSPLEIAAIQRAMEGKVTGSATLQSGPVQNIPLKREIALAGVAYRSSGDWIVWINGEKVTPKKLLPEIVDIQVSKDRVHLKWFDIGINNVISLSLRPHQTYDIVTGVLLP